MTMDILNRAMFAVGKSRGHDFEVTQSNSDGIFMIGPAVKGLHPTEHIMEDAGPPPGLPAPPPGLTPLGQAPIFIPAAVRPFSQSREAAEVRDRSASFGSSDDRFDMAVEAAVAKEDSRDRSGSENEPDLKGINQGMRIMQAFSDMKDEKTFTDSCSTIFGKATDDGTSSLDTKARTASEGTSFSDYLSNFSSSLPVATFGDIQRRRSEEFPLGCRSEAAGQRRRSSLNGMTDSMPAAIVEAPEENQGEGAEEVEHQSADVAEATGQADATRDLKQALGLLDQDYPKSAPLAERPAGEGLPSLQPPVDHRRAGWSGDAGTGDDIPAAFVDPTKSDISIFTPAEPATFTPLRATAKMWRPSGTVFQMEVLAVAEEVAAALREEYNVDAVARFWGMANGQGGGCVLVASIEPESFFVLRDQVEQAAKDGIFQRTNRTRGVCLIGFSSAPYIPTPQGFAVNLATVASKKKECRRLYRNGFCRRGPKCDMEHPAFTVQLAVTITVANNGEFLSRE